MALLHRATMAPNKLELVAAWLPGRPWYQGEVADLRSVAAYRFDDPAGEVGIETLLVAAGSGPVHQVPLTYRGAPLPQAQEWLVGTCEHSVLGTRWVYDACGDPVYPVALAEALLSGADQAEVFIEVEGVLERRSPTLALSHGGDPVAGVPTLDDPRQVVDGDPVRIRAGGVELTVLRRLGESDAPTRPRTATLTGTWPQGSTLLATATPT